MHKAIPSMHVLKSIVVSHRKHPNPTSELASHYLYCVTVALYELIVKLDLDLADLSLLNMLYNTFLYYRDLMRAHRVASRLEAGSLYINNYNIYPVRLPFGGHKKSGIGRENAVVTLDSYTQVKSVYVEMDDVDAPF